jgi:hypothetical protein
MCGQSSIVRASLEQVIENVKNKKQFAILVFLADEKMFSMF